MYDIMIDLETSGTEPNKSAIIQIAAVQFDYETGAIGKTFDRCLWFPPGRYWDEDTREWWGKNPDILNRIFDQAEDPAVVVPAFAEWCRSVTMGMQPLRMWAKPISFEFPFLSSYFRQFGQENPFHFREAIDMQSFIRGTRQNPNAPAFDKEVPFVGDVHYAIDDCFHQILVTQHAKILFRPEVAQ